MRADRVEQVFVRRQSGRTEVLLVLESPAGDRTRETLPMAATSFEEAVRRAAVQLARRGIVPARRLRLRAERGDSLVDDDALREAFLAVLAREGQREQDPAWD